MMGRVIAVPQIRKSLLRHGSGTIKVEGVPAESVRLAWRSRSPLQPRMFSFIPHLHKYKKSVSEYSFFTHQRYILYNQFIEDKNNRDWPKEAKISRQSLTDFLILSYYNEFKVLVRGYEK